MAYFEAESLQTDMTNCIRLELDEILKIGL